MPDASAAEAAERKENRINAAFREAAERKRVMLAVANNLEAAMAQTDIGLAPFVAAAITELRTPVGREKNQ